jgi:hypothetical protein
LAVTPATKTPPTFSSEPSSLEQGIDGDQESPGQEGCSEEEGPGHPAKKAAAKKKAPAKKAAAKKKAPAKKAAAKKKAPAKKAAAKKKAPAKKAAAKKKAPAKKAAAKKKAPAKKEPVVKVYRPKARMGPEGVMILAEDKVLLRAFYGGQQMPSPNEGFLMLLGVRAKDDGGAIAVFECSVSSLRYHMSIANATRGERTKVREAQRAGGDPDCPRHGPGQRLVRAGKSLVCTVCGVVYGKV